MTPQRKRQQMALLARAAAAEVLAANTDLVELRAAKRRVLGRLSHNASLLRSVAAQLGATGAGSGLATGWRVLVGGYEVGTAPIKASQQWGLKANQTVPSLSAPPQVWKTHPAWHQKRSPQSSDSASARRSCSSMPLQRRPSYAARLVARWRARLAALPPAEGLAQPRPATQQRACPRHALQAAAHPLQPQPLVLPLSRMQTCRARRCLAWNRPRRRQNTSGSRQSRLCCSRSVRSCAHSLTQPSPASGPASSSSPVACGRCRASSWCTSRSCSCSR
jgi:hypothetical protein